MTESRYLYSAVRVVPSVSTGEFVNLAVIAGSDETGEWSLRLLSDERRARQFCGVDAISAAHDVLARLGYQIDLHTLLVEELDGEERDPDVALASEVSEKWLRDLHELSNRVVQFSQPAPVLAESIDAAMDTVFPRMTVQPEQRARRTLTKWRLLSDLGKSYISAGLVTGDFLRQPTLIAQGPSNYTYPVDFVVANGRAVQLVQTWSFEVASQDLVARDVKAWGWTVKELQDHGGLVQTEDHTVSAPSNVAIEVVVAPPTEGQSVAAYEEAKGLFAELGVAVQEHGAEGEVARRGADLLAKARGKDPLA